jgi:hypothetical protein
MVWPYWLHTCSCRAIQFRYNIPSCFRFERLIRRQSSVVGRLLRRPDPKPPMFALAD